MKRLDDAYFDRIYANGDDPWGFETKWYEKRKYALTVAALPRARYRRAFEPGCANGVLTRALADRCEVLLSMEPVDAIARRARERVADQPHVTVTTGAIPDRWPTGTFDLIVASEVLYYLTSDGLDEALATMAGLLSPDGHVVAVHYRGETDYPLTGDATHARLAQWPAVKRIAHHEEDLFQLDVFEVR